MTEIKYNGKKKINVSILNSKAKTIKKYLNQKVTHKLYKYMFHGIGLVNFQLLLESKYF